VNQLLNDKNEDGDGRNWTYDDSTLGTGMLSVSHDGAATPFSVVMEGTYESTCDGSSPDYTCAPGINSGDPETSIDLKYGGDVLFSGFLTAQTCDDGSVVWGECPAAPPSWPGVSSTTIAVFGDMGIDMQDFFAVVATTTNQTIYLALGTITAFWPFWLGLALLGVICVIIWMFTRVMRRRPIR